MDCSVWGYLERRSVDELLFMARCFSHMEEYQYVVPMIKEVILKKKGSVDSEESPD